MLRKTSIQVQLFLFITLALVLLVGAVGFFQATRVRTARIDSERNRSLALTGSVSSTIQAVSPLIATLEDVTELHQRLTDLVSQSSGIDFIAVTWPDGAVLFHSNPAFDGQTIPELANPVTNKTVSVTVPSYGRTYLTSTQFNNPVDEGPDQFDVIVGADAGVIDGAVRSDILLILAASVVSLAIVGIIALYFLRNTVTQPVRALADGAQAFSQGNLDYKIGPRGSREFFELAETLNHMAGELKESYAQVEMANRTLERNINARVRDLATLTEVSIQASTILDVPQLLQAVSDLTKENFDLYHAHIYMLDDSGDYLTLAAGAGDVGREMVKGRHRIALNMPNSLVARAARTREVVSLDDVSEAPDFLPNPLLPDTKSELAAPLVARGQLLGVLDVQSAILGRFDAETRSVMETLGRQIAAALSNAQLFSEVDRTGRHEQALGAITQQIQGAVNMDEVLQVTARELGKVLRVPHTRVALQMKQEPEIAKKAQTRPLSGEGLTTDPEPTH